MLKCLNCCCRICTDGFDREDSSDVVTGSPASCEWSQDGPYIELLDGRVQMQHGDSLTGAEGDRVEVTLRSFEPDSHAGISLGSIWGRVVFGNPGYILLIGGKAGILVQTCELLPDVDYTFFLCRGVMDEDPDVLGAEFGIVGSSECVLGDEIDPVTTEWLVLSCTRGRVEWDDVKLDYVVSEERPSCPECIAEQSPPGCRVCEDTFTREDNDDINTGQSSFIPCTYVDSGDAEIKNTKLYLPSGTTVTADDCDYVVFTASSEDDGAELTVMIGTVGVTITFGDGDSSMSIIAPGVGGTQTTDLPTLVLDAVGNRFVLCINIVDSRAGVVCIDTDDFSQQVTGLMNPNPASPFGELSFSTSGGDVYIDNLSVWLRTSEGVPVCTTCHPNLCEICADTSPNFETSDCQWEDLGGFGALGSDWVASGELAAAVSGVGNPDGRPIMVLSSTWEWGSPVDSDTVRLYVATPAGSEAGPCIQITLAGYYDGAGCTELYSATGELLSTVANNGGLDYSSLYCDGEGVWTGGDSLTFGDMLGRNGLDLPGSYAALGTGDSFDGSYVSFGAMNIDWYAADPWHKDCTTTYRNCTIFSVGFPAYYGHAILSFNSSAGDPATVVNCHVDYSAGDWAADHANDVWATQENDATITILTNHPDNGPNLSAVITWWAKVGTPESGDADTINAKYSGLQLHYTYSGTAITVEFVGGATGGVANVWFWELTIDGVGGIVADYGAGPFAAGIWQPMWACFGATRSRILGFTPFGFQGSNGPTAGDGTGIGIATGSSLYGVGDADCALEGITMEHTTASIPNNEFTGLDPPDCTDCDQSHCVVCEDNTPPTLTVSIALKEEADTGDLCEDDIADLTGTFVLDNRGLGCEYAIYFGPTAKEDVADYCDTIINYNNSLNCHNFLGLKATLSFNGAGVQIVVEAVGITGSEPWDNPTWTGSVAVINFDCTDFSIDLTTEGGSLSDLFDVTAEYSV